jgi:hypothetical protein
MNTVSTKESLDLIEIPLCSKNLVAVDNFGLYSNANNIMVNDDDDDDVDYVAAKSDIFTSDVSETGRTSNNVLSDQSNQDSPQSMVRIENKAFHLLRAILVVAFLAGAVGSATFVYIFIRNSEKQTFAAEYEAISSFVRRY